MKNQEIIQMKDYQKINSRKKDNKTIPNLKLRKRKINTNKKLINPVKLKLRIRKDKINRKVNRKRIFYKGTKRMMKNQ